MNNSVNKVKRVLNVFFLFSEAQSNQLNFSVYYSTEIKDLPFNEYENLRKNRDPKEYYHYFYNNKKLLFYTNIESKTVYSSIKISKKKPTHYVVNDKPNELPFTITKMVTDLKTQAIIEIELSEEMDKKYNFANLKGCTLSLTLADVPTYITRKVEEIVGVKVC